MGADLILLDFDISLVHNQSRVEALLLSHTFIGSAYRAFTKEENVTALLDDTVVNVEYQGDNIIGCFDCNGNHAIFPLLPIFPHSPVLHFHLLDLRRHWPQS